MAGSGRKVFYAGTFTEYLYVLELDEEREKISVINRVDGLNRPAYLCVSRDRKFLYSANENSDGQGGVSAFDLSDKYGPRHLNTIVSDTPGPCYVALSEDQHYLLAAGYFDGRVNVHPINNDGSLAGSCCMIQHTGSGPFRGGIIVSSQAQARAHSIFQVPGTNDVLVADLGSDTVYVYALEKGLLTEHSRANTVPGAGPRHMALHPSGDILYTINELNNTITVFDFNKNTGILKPYRSVSTLPEGHESRSWCSAIRVSQDGRFLYGSNREHDSISVFKAEEGGREISLSGFFSKTVDNPRDFAIDPSGRYMLIGNLDADSITLCRLSGDTGMPEYIGNTAQIEIPAYILFV